jgi:DNA-binding transcriptional LysR family regulator
MNERQLKYILTIAEEGNITSAAQKLYISQPSLSSLLAHVEGELGCKLFNRDLSPMTLTYAGECYVAAAKRILSVQKELQNQIDDILDYRKSRLIIGCSTQLSSLFFPAILPRFIKENPGVQIKLYEESVPVLEELLMSGVLELLFTNLVIDNKAFGSIPLYVEELVLLTPADFNPPGVAEREGCHFPVIDPGCFGQLPFVLFKHKHQLRKLADKIFADYEIQPKIFLETDNWELCFSLVEAGLAFTLLPYSPLKKIQSESYNKIHFFSINGNYSRQLIAYYRKNMYHQRIIETFLDLTQTILNEFQ